VNPTEVLTAITLAVSGWTLLKVIHLSEDVSAMRERIRGMDERTE